MRSFAEMTTSGFASQAALLIAASCVLAVFGCTSGTVENGEPPLGQTITVGMVSVDYPKDYSMLSPEKASEMVSEDGSSYTLHRTVVGSEDYAETCIVEYAEGMTLADAKAEVVRAMNLLANPDALDSATLALAEATTWEPIEEARVDGEIGFVSSRVMYGDTKVVTYHVETGSNSIGMVTCASALDAYNENPAIFNEIFASMEVL